MFYGFEVGGGSRDRSAICAEMREMRDVRVGFRASAVSSPWDKDGKVKSTQIPLQVIRLEFGARKVVKWLGCRSSSAFLGGTDVELSRASCRARRSGGSDDATSAKRSRRGAELPL